MENNTSCNLAINEFKSIQYNENEIILANSKKEEQLIVLSIVEKVYIKRCRLNLISKLLLVAMSLCLTLFLMAYFSIEIVFFQAILSIIVLIKLNEFKWYHLNINLYNGTSYRKVFHKSKKQEYIDLVNEIKIDLFYQRVKSNNQITDNLQSEKAEKSTSHYNLSIA